MLLNTELLTLLFIQGCVAEHFGSNQLNIHKVILSLITTVEYINASHPTVSTTVQVYLVF